MLNCKITTDSNVIIGESTYDEVKLSLEKSSPIFRIISVESDMFHLFYSDKETIEVLTAATSYPDREELICVTDDEFKEITYALIKAISDLKRENITDIVSLG